MTACSQLPRPRRVLLGWFGIKGIGSINYIAYAYVHGLHGSASVEMINIAITLVVTSVILHGITVAPILQSRKLTSQDSQQ